MSQSNGQFVWYELMTSDAEAATQFYQSVVGWDALRAPMPGGDYTILSVDGVGVGGLMTLTEQACAMGVPPCWTGYVGVDDVDGYVTRVTSAGGTLMRAAEDIPGVGRFAVVADPYGAAFILFKGSSAESPAPAPSGTPGHFGWHELHAGDGAGAFDFYSGLFGWTKSDAIDMGPLGIYQLFASGGAAVGGMMTKTADTPGPFWQYYINVAAIDAAAAKVEAGGGKVFMGPHQVPGGSWIVNCKDPQGAFFALVAPQR